MTAERLLAEATRTSDLFQLLVESVEDYAIFLLDRNGYILSWNAGAQRIKGYRAEEIIGRHFSVFYQTEDIAAGVPVHALATASAKGRWEREGWRIRKDGSKFWANVVITALRDRKRGDVIGFAKVTRDLTERRKAEEERERLLTLERAARMDAEQSIEQLRSIQSLTELALAHLDLDSLLNALLNRILAIMSVDTVAVLLLEGGDSAGDPNAASYLVPRAAKGLEEEVRQGIRIPIGRDFADTIVAERGARTPSNIRTQVLNRMLRDKGVHAMLGVPLMVEGHVTGVLHVGTFRHRRFTKKDVQFLEIVGDRVALAIEHTRLIDLARSAHEEARIAEAAVQDRDEFLSVAAHELKTPITSLRIAAQLIDRRLGPGREVDRATLQRTVQAIDHQSHQLARLVSQLLDRVRIQGGRLGLEKAQTDLSALLDEVVQRAQLSTEAHRIIAERDTQVSAFVDAIRVEQVLTNLLDNAVKFTPQGGTIQIGLCRPQTDRVRITVADTGIGVPPERRDQLFERFFQAHRDEHRSGLGLGLYICKEIVNMHGGTIRAEFPESGGTRMIIELPVEEAVLTDRVNGEAAAF